MAPTLAPDGSVIDDGSVNPTPFAGAPSFIGPRPIPTVANLSSVSVPRDRAATALPLTDVAPPPDATLPAPAQKPPDVMPQFLFNYARRPGSLTKPATIPAATPEQAQAQTPGYWQSSTDPNTGLPSIANPNLTKLGKVLTLLRGAGMGFAEGSTQPTLGRGFMAATEFQNQQAQQNQAIQQRAMQMEQQRQLLPLQQQEAYAKLHGVSSWQYYRDADGNLVSQGMDIMGNPVGQPIKNATQKNANLDQIWINDPEKDPDGSLGLAPVPAYRDKQSRNVYYQGRVLPEEAVHKFETKEMPAAGSQAEAARAVAGAPPRGNVYNGKTYSTPADAAAAWNFASQQAKITGVPITAEMAQQYGIPQEFLGYKLKPSDFASLQRAQNQRYIPIQTGDGEVVVDKQTKTAQLVRFANGQPTTPVAWAAPREVADENNPGLTKFVTGGTAIRTGAQGTGSAGFLVPREIATREVPTKGGDLRMGFGTMIDHANLLRQAAAALNYYGPDSQQVRGLENKFRNEFGGSGPITAQAIADAYGDEVAGVINKGHITDKGNEKVEHTLDPTHQNYETIDSVLRAYQNLAQSKMNQLDLAEQRAAQRVQPKPKAAPAAGPKGGGLGAKHGSVF